MADNDYIHVRLHKDFYNKIKKDIEADRAMRKAARKQATIERNMKKLLEKQKALAREKNHRDNQ